MLEQLADYDDDLMEKLLGGHRRAEKDLRVRRSLASSRKGSICPVLMGSAENGNGIMRLLKAIRHEVPFVGTTAKRLEDRERQERGVRDEDALHRARAASCRRAS